MDRAVELVATALRSLAEGRGQNPLRWPMHLEGGRGLLGMMPGALNEPAAQDLEAEALEALGLKVVAIFPANHGTNLDAHQGFVALFDPNTGVPRAVIDGSELTARRTAAVSALATRELSNPDAGDLALIGTGVQARAHLEALASVRPLRRVRAHSPREERRDAFTVWARERHAIEVEPCSTVESCVADADLVCTVTTASEPILHGDWLTQGTHVNAVGACIPNARELAGSVLARSAIYTDARESLEKESGDWLLALAEGAVEPDHLRGELGEVLTGHCPGRRNRDEITVFESLGLAVEDLAVAHDLMQRARADGIGTEVPLEPAGD